MPIITLDALRAHLGIPAADSAESPRLWTALQAASSEAERGANRRFLPGYAARWHPPSGRACLPLAGDLLELLAVTDGAGQALADALPAPDAPPYDHLLRPEGSAFSQGPYTVTGVWGWHDGSDSAGWQSAGQILTSGLLAAETLLTVPDADATGPGGGTLFEVGTLLRLNQEFLWVLAVDVALNRLTLARAAQGSPAADHAPGTLIQRWQSAPLVAGWVLRRAAALYRAPDGLALPLPEADVLRTVRRLTVSTPSL